MIKNFKRTRSISVLWKMGTLGAIKIKSNFEWYTSTRDFSKCLCTVFDQFGQKGHFTSKKSLFSPIYGWFFENFGLKMSLPLELFGWSWGENVGNYHIWPYRRIYSSVYLQYLTKSRHQGAFSHQKCMPIESSRAVYIFRTRFEWANNVALK